MGLFRFILFFLFVLVFSGSQAQKVIPTEKVIENGRLSEFLKPEVKNIIGKGGHISEAELAHYFREKFSERFFYDWQSFDQRFELYNSIYDNRVKHEQAANDHMQKYAGSTNWLLPFNYLNGEEVNAYALRHLARQHKMVDVAFEYFYENKNPEYIQYFVQQMASLNLALESGRYEKIKDGNGVYEAFRSGYRVLNWLGIHNMFLGQDEYSDEYQLVTIATLLQHGAHLYASNTKFTSGNHQTRGMSALAMLSILLRDFEGTDLWYQRSMDLLEQHLMKEINNDGFQFERSVHYHMSDIENYFYVYQLAKISNIEVSESWEMKLRELFTTLAKIAYPDKSAPVLQDDTNDPWAEKNDISGALTLGYLLFGDPEFGYFADNKVEAKMYWFLKGEQLKQLESVSRKQPDYGSLMFPDTKYYIMREGWDVDDKMMVVSAGLDSEKPDHQHADMLGIQAMANGQVILPNYQVRYSLADFDFFKNSMVKNVALVDDEVQGKEWTSNQGGSGFGKFLNLPNPTTIVWQTNDNFDLFAGKHDGFENIGVGYTRQVIFVNNDFWVVKDNFTSSDQHEYKQVWQGHYSYEEGPDLIRSNFPDASGCDILQLNSVDELYGSGQRGKNWTVVSKKDLSDFNFITLIYPYSGYSNRINEKDLTQPIKGWTINNLPFEAKGDQLQSLSGNSEYYLFNSSEMKIKNTTIEFSLPADVFVKIDNQVVIVHSISDKNLDVEINGGTHIKLNNVEVDSQIKINPGDIVNIEVK